MPRFLIPFFTFLVLSNSTIAAPFELIGCEDSNFYITNIKKDCTYASPMNLKFKTNNDKMTFQSGMIVAALSPCKKYFLTIPSKKVVAYSPRTIQDNISQKTHSENIAEIFSDASYATDWLINNHSLSQACTFLSRLSNPYVHLYKYK